MRSSKWFLHSLILKKLKGNRVAECRPHLLEISSLYIVIVKTRSLILMICRQIMPWNGLLRFLVWFKSPRRRKVFNSCLFHSTRYTNIVQELNHKITYGPVEVLLCTSWLCCGVHALKRKNTDLSMIILTYSQTIYTMCSFPKTNENVKFNIKSDKIKKERKKEKDTICCTC